MLGQTEGEKMTERNRKEEIIKQQQQIKQKN